MVNMKDYYEALKAAGVVRKALKTDKELRAWLKNGKKENSVCVLCHKAFSLSAKDNGGYRDGKAVCGGCHEDYSYAW
jgi:hypothetical protein